MRKIALALVALLAAAACTTSNVSQGSAAPAPFAAAPQRVAPITTIKALANGQTVATFKYGTSPDEVGDVYYDADWPASTTKRDAIIVVHGGWWHNATRTNAAGISQKWLDAGFVVFDIDYRVAADHAPFAGSGVTGTQLGSRWPAQRIDVALAADFLKANAAQFGLDGDSIGCYGFSAGGHICHTAAGYYGTGRFKASASVSAVLQPHRAADIASNGTWGNDVSTPTIVKSFGYATSALGCSYEPTWYDCGNKWDSFKPETYFNATGPAFYAIKGDDDPVEPKSALEAIEYWLDKAGQDHVTLLVAGGTHNEAMISGTGSADITRWNNLVSWMHSKL
jgi:acetyl esterase/lipase